MNPYLSVVVGIGGNVTRDLIHRLQDSVANSSILAKQVGLDLEIVIVEWNVRDSIESELPFLGYARVIHAGAAHATVPNPHGFKYFEWYPKNIGIRRAHGEFVLSTNPDDLFSLELFEFLATRPLQKGVFYRANRHDTKDGKAYRICHPTGCYQPEATEAEIRVPVKGAAPWHPNMLSFNASGDFMLMSKDDWFKIHGNPERPYSHTVDGQTVWLAHTKGLKQVVLPYPFYHPDHERTLNIAGNGKMYGPEWDDNKPFTQENGDDWGFANTTFEETVL